MEALERVLGEIQRRGGVGRGPIGAAVAHARFYVDALPSASGRLVDLGSGGGLPGLVIASLAPGWQLALVERRAKRADLLRYAVAALELGGRVEVLGMAAEEASRTAAWAASCDVVTARSFGPPLSVIDHALPFLRADGLVIISEPPDHRARWTDAELTRRGVIDAGEVGLVRRFRRTARAIAR